MLFKTLRRHLENNHKQRARLHRKCNAYETLEPRQLLVAGITFDAGTVFIEGSNDNDSSMVMMIDESTISVSLTGGIETETFALADVNLIRFRGLDGNDRFTNSTDINATAFGHDGDDRFQGGGGHNRFQGGNGDDVLIGGSRNDSLRGRDGNDLIFGGLRHDRIFGGDGDDEIRGEHGRDRINGDGGNDQLIGGNHDDRINGGDGEDTIIGNAGIDRLFGGADDDVIKGGDGNDILSGDAGNDTIRGFNGDDELYGDSGTDVLDGGAGNDVLLGGIGNADDLDGGNGFDRYLTVRGDNVAAVDSGDAVIEFVDDGSLLDGGIWIDEQIKAVDAAFALISQRTENSHVLLQDSTSGNAVRFVKGNDLEPGNVVDDDEFRTITLANWDVASEEENQATVVSVIHQIAYTWDSMTEINTAFPGSINHIGVFRAVSGWTEGTDVPAGFVASTDGEWYFRAGTEFLDDRGMINPSEDWATIWELVLDPMAAEGDLDRLTDKFSIVSEFFDSVTP